MATVVAFHAHPDDEALLTGGILAKLSAEGHCVVIVLACSVPLQAADSGSRTRLDELARSAAILGVAEVVHLGYADSGHGPVLCADPPGGTRFARADPDEVAQRLAAILREQQADLLLSYDARGGNGHRDHVQVHEVGARAAALTGIRVLEATLPRELVLAVFSPLRLARLLVGYSSADMRTSFTPRASITHRAGVRRYARPKQAALAAHRSQVFSAGRSARLKRLVLALPVPVYGLIFGREWFAEPGAAACTVSGDVLEPAS